MKNKKNKIYAKLKNLLPKGVYLKALEVFLFFRAIKYIGNEVYCPCCNNSFKKFYPDWIYGQCPRCGSSARHRLLILYLERKTNYFKKKLKVLHFAPENGLYRKFKKMKNLDYIAADIGSPRAKYKIDMTNIPFEDDSFDVVLSIHVLEHIEDDLKAIKELYRVQKRTGWSIHLVPITKTYETTYERIDVTSDNERRKYYGHPDHRRICGLDYYERFRKIGFDVIPDDFANDLLQSDIKKYGINPEEIIYLCLKNEKIKLTNYNKIVDSNLIL
ncbi:MAG: class I SAM-dependent methyltransferase [Bacteroidales bacterium]|nr:class I SAM-dependent methyltransferase [Bacteroidales bacterium]